MSPQTVRNTAHINGPNPHRGKPTQRNILANAPRKEKQNLARRQRIRSKTIAYLPPLMPLIKITLPSSFVDGTVIPFVSEIQKPETSNRVGPNCFRTKAFQTHTRAKAQRSERILDLQNPRLRTETKKVDFKDLRRAYCINSGTQVILISLFRCEALSFLLTPEIDIWIPIAVQ